MPVLERLKRIQSGVAVAAAIGDCEEIVLEAASAAIYVPAELSELTFHGSNSVNAGGTFSAIRRRAAADTDYTSFEAVTLNTGGTAGWYPLPDECQAFRRIKIQDTATTPSGTPVDITLAGST